MRILDVSAITNSKQFFPKQGTLQFLQDAYKEQLNNICLSLLGSIAYSPTTAYVLFGCVNSGSGSNYVISAGAIFYNGEVFSVPAVSLTASGNVPVANIVTAQYTVNADPVTYSDATTGNIHNIRTIAIGLGTSGSGISDYSNFVNVSLVQPSQVLLIGGTTAFTPTLSTDPANKGYVDAAVAVKCIYAGNINNSNTPKANQLFPTSGLGSAGSVTVTSGTTGGENSYTVSHAIGNSNYFVTFQGSDISNETTYANGVISISNNSFIIPLIVNSGKEYPNVSFQIWQYQ